MLPHSFSAKSQTFLWSSAQKSYLFAERICDKHKSFLICNNAKVLVTKVRDSNGKNGNLFKNCKIPQLFDLNSAFTIGLVA